MMSDTVAELVERGKSLSAQDRTRLVELLRETLDEPVDPEVEEAWRLELRRRTSTYERGEAILYDANDVIAEATRITL
jgi:putative addiction module component (TIGR02574 family)